MTDEQAREILKKHCSAYGDSRYEPARWILDAMQEAAAVECDRCARIVERIKGWTSTREIAAEMRAGQEP